jgi:transcriptional regulator with XRE-family HTH domain
MMRRAKALYIYVSYIYNGDKSLRLREFAMITAAQMRAARALLAMDQRELAERSGLSVPTIQRMEASEGVIRGNVDSLVKLIAGLEAAGVELIREGEISSGGGRGVRLKG